VIAGPPVENGGLGPSKLVDWSAVVLLATPGTIYLKNVG